MKLEKKLPVHSCINILLLLFLITALSIILMCAHIVQCPFVCSYCSVSFCVRLLSSILMCAHIVHCPYVCSCIVQYPLLLLPNNSIVQYHHVCSYCPISSCVLILIVSSILRVQVGQCLVSSCVLIVSSILRVQVGQCPVSSCVLIVSSILRAQVGQSDLFPTGVMVAVYISYETSAARWTFSSPFTALPCFSGDRHR